MAVLFVFRRTAELGRRVGFLEVEDKLADKLIKKGVAKAARRSRRTGSVTPLPVIPPDAEDETEAAGKPRGNRAPTRSGRGARDDAEAKTAAGED